MARRLSDLLASLTPEQQQRVTDRVSAKGGLSNLTKNDFLVLLTTECPDFVLSKSALVSQFIEAEFNSRELNKGTPDNQVKPVIISQPEPTKKHPPPPPAVITPPVAASPRGLAIPGSPFSGSTGKLPDPKGEMKRSASARGAGIMRPQSPALPLTFKYYRVVLPPELGGWYYVQKSDTDFSMEQVHREILGKLIYHRKLTGVKLGDATVDLGPLGIVVEEQDPPSTPDFLEMGLWIAARFEQSLGDVPRSLVLTGSNFEGVAPPDFLDNSTVEVAVSHSFGYDLRPSDSPPDKTLAALQVRVASACSTYLASLTLQECAGPPPPTISIPTYIVAEEIRRWVLAYHAPTQDCTVSALAERLRNLDGFSDLSRSLRGCEEFQLDSKLLVILLHLEEFVKQARPPVAAQLSNRAFFEAMERLSSLTASLARHGALFLYMCGRDHSHLPEVLPTAVGLLYRAREGENFDVKSDMSLADWNSLKRLMSSQAGSGLSLLLDSEALHRVLEGHSSVGDALDELELCRNPFLPCSFSNFVRAGEYGGLLSFFCQSPSTGFAFSRLHALLFEIAKISLITQHCSDMLFASGSATNEFLVVWGELLSCVKASVASLGQKSQQFFQSWQLADARRLLSQPLINFLVERLVGDIDQARGCLDPIEKPSKAAFEPLMQKFLNHLKQVLVQVAEPEDPQESQDEFMHHATKYAQRAQELLLKGQCIEGTNCLRGGLDLCPNSVKLQLGFAEALELQQYASGEFLRKNEELRFARKTPPVDDEVLAGLCKSIMSPPCRWTLRLLELDDNEITTSGFVELFHALPNCPALARLSIAKNFLGDQGATALAAILNPKNGKYLQSLQQLDVTSTNIETEGAVALAQALAANATLKSFECGYNQIEDEGVQAMVASVSKNQRLQLNFLGLSSTGMGQKSGVAIIELLRENKTIDLSLGDESVPTHQSLDKDAWTEIKALLRTNRSRMPFAHKTTMAYSPDETGQMQRITVLYQKVFGEQPAPAVWQLAEDEDGEKVPSYKFGLQDFLRSRWLFACATSTKPFFQALVPNVLNMLSTLCTFQTQRQMHFTSTISDRLILNDPIALVCEEFKVWLTKELLPSAISHSTLNPQIGTRIYGQSFQRIVSLPIDNFLLRSLRGRRNFLRQARKLEHLKADAFCRLVDQLDVNLTQCLRVSELFWINDSLVAAVNAAVGLGRSLVFVLLGYVRKLADLPEECPLLNFPWEMGSMLEFLQKMFTKSEAAGTGAVSLFTFLKSDYLSVLFPDAGLPPSKLAMNDFDRTRNPFFSGARLGTSDQKQDYSPRAAESPRPKQPPPPPKSPSNSKTPGKLQALKMALKRTPKDEAGSPKDAKEPVNNPAALELEVYNLCGLTYEIGRVSYFLLEGRDLLRTQPVGSARLSTHVANLVRIQSGLAKLALDAVAKAENKSDLSGLQYRPPEILDPLTRNMSYYDVLRFLDRIVETESQLGSLEIDDENQGARLDLSTWEPGLPEAMEVQVWKESVRQCCSQCNTECALPANLVPSHMFLQAVVPTKDAHPHPSKQHEVDQRIIRRLLKEIVFEVQARVPDPVPKSVLEVKQSAVVDTIRMNIDNGEEVEVETIETVPATEPDASHKDPPAARVEPVLKPRATSRIAQNMEGWLWKLTRDSAFPRWVKRYFVLKDHCLAYWDSDKDYKHNKAGKRPLSLLGGTCKVCDGKKWACQNCNCTANPLGSYCLCGHERTAHVDSPAEGEVQLPKGKFAFQVTLAPSMSLADHAVEKTSYFGVQVEGELEEWVRVIRLNCDEKSLQRARKRSSVVTLSPLQQSASRALITTKKTKIIRKPPTVKNLVHQRLVKSNLDDKTVPALVEQVASLCRDQMLALYIDTSFGRIGPEGLLTFMDGVAKVNNARVVRFALRGNAIGQKGVEGLSRHLTTSAPWEKLTHLDLNSNAIGPAVVKLLADTLSNGPLTHLDLGYNPLGDTGVLCLANALRAAPLGRLKVLHLGGCDVSSASARVLRRAINYNINLTTLFLHENAALEMELANSIEQKLASRTNRVDPIASFLWADPYHSVPSNTRARDEIVNVDVRTYCRRCEKHFDGILKLKLGPELDEHVTELTKLLRLFPCKAEQCSSLLTLVEIERSYVRVLELLALTSLFASQIGALKAEKAHLQAMLFEGDFRQELSDWFVMLTEQAETVVLRCAKNFADCFDEDEALLQECCFLLHSTVEEYFQRNHSGDYKLSPQFIQRFENLRGSSQWFNYLQTTALRALFPKNNSLRQQAITWKGLANAEGEIEVHPELLRTLHATCELRLAPARALLAGVTPPEEDDVEEFVMAGFHGGKVEAAETKETKTPYPALIDSLKALVEDLVIVQDEMTQWFSSSNFDILQFFQLRYHDQFFKVLERSKKGPSPGECLAWIRFISWYEHELKEVEAESIVSQFQPYLTEFFQSYLSKQVDTTQGVVRNALVQERDDGNSAKENKGIWYTDAPSDIFELVGSTISSILTLPREVLSHSNLLKLCNLVTSLLTQMQHEQQLYIESAAITNPKQAAGEIGEYVWFPGDRKRPRGYILAQINNATTYEKFFEESVTTPLLEKFDEVDKPTNPAQLEKEAEDRANIDENFYECGAAFMDLATSAMEVVVNLLLAVLKEPMSRLFSSGMSNKFWLDVSRAEPKATEDFLCSEICQQLTDFWDVVVNALAEESKARALMKVILHRVMALYAQAFTKCKPAVGKHHNFVKFVTRDMTTFQKCFGSYELVDDDVIERHTMDLADLLEGLLTCEEELFSAFFPRLAELSIFNGRDAPAPIAVLEQVCRIRDMNPTQRSEIMNNFLTSHPLAAEKKMTSQDGKEAIRQAAQDSYEKLKQRVVDARVVEKAGKFREILKTSANAENVAAKAEKLREKFREKKT